MASHDYLKNLSKTEKAILDVAYSERFGVSLRSAGRARQRAAKSSKAFKPGTQTESFFSNPSVQSKIQTALQTDELDILDELGFQPSGSAWEWGDDSTDVPPGYIRRSADEFHKTARGLYDSAENWIELSGTDQGGYDLVYMVAKKLAPGKRTRFSRHEKRYIEEPHDTEFYLHVVYDVERT